MDDSAKTVALVKFFGELTPDVAAELLSILRSYGLSDEELFYKWESYCIKIDPDNMKLNIETVRLFKKYTQELLEKEIRAKTRHNSSTSRQQKTPRHHKNSGDPLALLVSLGLVCLRVVGSC